MPVLMPVSYFIETNGRKKFQMKRYRSEEMKKAYDAGGDRERYAMEHGNRSVVYEQGHKFFKFTYSSSHERQDANGAMYDTVLHQWRA
jgi:hypothetical protein